MEAVVKMALDHRIRLATFDWLAGVLSLLAAILLLWQHMGVIAVLAICALLGLAVRLIF